MIDELRVTEGESRRDVLNRIEQKVLTDLPAIPFASNVNMMMWNDNVHGILPSNDRQLALEKAWISD